VEALQLLKSVYSSGDLPAASEALKWEPRPWKHSDLIQYVFQVQVQFTPEVVGSGSGSAKIGSEPN